MSFLTRRHFLGGVGGLALSAVGTLAYTRFVEPHWVEVVRRPLPIANLPESWVGHRVVQISDLHIGPVVSDDYMRESLRSVAELEPDLLVITGDLMTCRHAEQVKHTLYLLRDLAPGRLGSVVILGNHDYGHRWSDPEPADQITAGLRDRGLTVLRNQSIDLDGLTVAGLDDLWSPRWNPGRTLAGLDPDGANLLLCHNPDACDLPELAGYRGPILSGHTHGGQCVAPILGAPILPVRNKRYQSGHYPLAHGGSVYINRGLGYSRAVRFGARPEITCFTLSQALAV